MGPTRPTSYPVTRSGRPTSPLALAHSFSWYFPHILEGFPPPMGSPLQLATDESPALLRPPDPYDHDCLKAAY